MKFDLTRNQIRILVINDPTFLDTILDKLPDYAVLDVVEEKAKDIVTKLRKLLPKGWIMITAIKELRQWSTTVPSNYLDGYEKSGRGFLSLSAAKSLIEKYDKN